jgi:hypothetical protein
LSPQVFCVFRATSSRRLRDDEFGFLAVSGALLHFEVGRVAKQNDHRPTRIRTGRLQRPKVSGELLDERVG